MPAWRRGKSWERLAVLLCGAALLYRWLAPSVVNGDGLGYLRAALRGGVYPGHLGYLPLLRGLSRIFSATRPVALLPAARALSIASAVGALAAFAGAARQLGLRSWLMATAGLASSFAVLASASDVECYAPALLCVCLALYLLVRKQPLGAALAITAAALIHVENLLLVIPLALAFSFPRRAWAALPLALVGAAYLWAGLTPLGAAHGFHYPLHLWTPLVAVYGAAKALVYSPYRYEASWTRVIGCFLVGAAALAALLRLAFAGGAPLGRAVTVGWLAPYAAVGVAFFASDHERWIFLLPLAWLSVAAAARSRETGILAAAILIANVFLWLPRARDDSWRTAAERATTHLQAGDLVISPGHGWDEYVSFWSGPEVRPFPLVYFAGALGGRAPLGERLAQEIARAPRVILVRMDDDSDPMGYKELRLFGITRDIAGALISGERVPLGDGVFYLRPSGGDTRSKN